MELVNAVLRALIVAMLTWMGSAYLGQLIKYKNQEYAVGALGLTVISICVQAAYYTSNHFDWAMIIFIAMQVAAIAAGLYFGLSNREFHDDFEKTESQEKESKE